MSLPTSWKTANVNHAAVARATLAVVEVETNVSAVLCLPKEFWTLSSFSSLLSLAFASLASLAVTFLSLSPLSSLFSVRNGRWMARLPCGDGQDSSEVKFLQL